MRKRSLSAGTAVLASLAAGTVLASGRIDVGGAVLTTGAATTRGTVTVDADGAPGPLPQIAAPELPGPPEELSDSYGAALRNLPEQRGGGDEPFHASANVTLDAGTYDFSTITVDRDVEVLCDGAVVLRAAGDVLVEGAIRAVGSSADVTIVCGGDFTARTVAGHAAARIEAGSYPGTVAIDALGDVVVTGRPGSECLFLSSEGVLLSAHSATSRLDVRHARARAGAHGVYLRSDGDVALDSVGLISSGGGMYVASFGGDTSVANCDLDTGALGIRFDAKGSLAFTGSAIRANHTSLWAVEGDVSLGAATSVRIGTGGPCRIQAGAGVSVTGASSLRHLSPTPLEITAYGGAIAVGGAPGDASLVEATSSSGLHLAAADGVSVASGASVRAVDGPVAIDAAGGSVQVAGELKSRFGDVGIRAAGDVAFTGTGVSGASVRVETGGSVALVGDAAIANAGALEVLAAGDVQLRGSLWAAQGMSLVTTAGNLDAAGASLATTDAASASGSVLLECWNSDSPSIDLTGAELVTGDATDVSGDIVVRIRTDEAAGSADNAELEMRSLRASRSRGALRLTGRGRLTADVPLAELGATATLVLGGETRELARVASSGGAATRYAGDGCSLRIRPTRVPGRFRCDFVWRNNTGAAPGDSVAVSIHVGGLRSGVELAVARARR